MFGRSRAADPGQSGRPRREIARRGVAIAGALALELLLVLLLLSLGRWDSPAPPPPFTVVPFEGTSERETPPEEPPSPEPERAAATVATASPQTVAPVPEPAPTSVIPETLEPLASFDLSKIPSPTPPPRAATGGPVVGPPNNATSGDTARVGTAPNGEPLYAAAWYRKPYDDELRGYLSTASGPGWGLIACRTAPDYRVEDCVALQESPPGSNINRAVLAAAWQFKVRPPRLGGRSMVGTWVRIRIDYTIER